MRLLRRRAKLAAPDFRLLVHGKTKMQALVATMRKLLHAIFGMFKHDQLFDGAKVYALSPAPSPSLVPQEVACA